MNANFLQVSHIFYVWYENRTCSVSIRLDQKNRQCLVFPRSILRNIFYKMASTARPSCSGMGLNSQNKNYHVSLEYITKDLDGKIGLCERQHFSSYTKKNWNDNWTKIGSCEPTFKGALFTDNIKFEFYVKEALFTNSAKKSFILKGHNLAVTQNFKFTGTFLPVSSAKKNAPKRTIKLQLHDAIYWLWFYSNSLTHILLLSNSHSDVPSIQTNRGDKSHHVTVALHFLSIFSF